jgi:Concanavalin A-like lectin/glucanases superfamily
VAVTWDGTTNASNIHIYINGVPADGTATNGSGTPLSDATTPFTIGNRPVDEARNFDGSIYGVRVYNRMLSSQEIQSLVNGGS